MKKLKLIINNNFKKEQDEFFIKKELQCILDLYAKMVSNGSWKDYSFSSGKKKYLLMYIKDLLTNQCFEDFKNLKPNYYNEKFLIKDKNGNVLKNRKI